MQRPRQVTVWASASPTPSPSPRHAPAHHPNGERSRPAPRVLPGGGPANTAVSLGRLGTPIRFLGRLSGDVFGRLFRAHYGSGVDLSDCADGGRTQHAGRRRTGREDRPPYSLPRRGHGGLAVDAGGTGRGWTLRAPVCVHTGSLALVREPGGRGWWRSSWPRAAPAATGQHRPQRPAAAGRAGRLPRPPGRLVRAGRHPAAERGATWDCVAAGTPPEAGLRQWHAAGVRLVVVTLGAQGALASLDGERLAYPGCPHGWSTPSARATPSPQGFCTTSADAASSAAGWSISGSATSRQPARIGTAVAALTCCRRRPQPAVGEPVGIRTQQLACEGCRRRAGVDPSGALTGSRRGPMI